MLFTAEKVRASGEHRRSEIEGGMVLTYDHVSIENDVCVCMSLT